jgi:GH25 family lysozyme M1 (1,4-beta-N-acetylmuramidase)
MARTLHLADTGAEVRALQSALNVRAEPVFHPPVAKDGVLGPATMHAFQAIGWALGFSESMLGGREIGPVGRALTAHPADRGPAVLQRARRRAPQLHLRTIAFDGTPTYWGLAKPMLLAREHGWGGRLSSSDRRSGVAEKFGKKSQATLFRCAELRDKLHRCPPQCGGDCAAANAPGESSHEQRSDATGFPGPKKRLLEWYELGIDVSDSDRLIQELLRRGYQTHRTYPNNPDEHHHLNFTASPGPVLPAEGPHHTAHIAKISTPVSTRTKASSRARTSAPVAVTLTGPDVSENQPDVDWRKVKSGGHAFAIAKVSDGLGTPDPTFGKGRWKAMKDAGLIRGAYHFGRPQQGRDPKAEVAEFLDILKAAGGLAAGDLLPILDLEKFGKAGKLTARQTLEWTRDWVGELRRRVGRKPIIYTGAFWRDDLKNVADDLGCPLWLAAYVPASKVKQFVPTAWKQEGQSLWQFTDKATCPGIAGRCDMSRFAGTREQFNRLRF